MRSLRNPWRKSWLRAENFEAHCLIVSESKAQQELIREERRRSNALHVARRLNRRPSSEQFEKRLRLGRGNCWMRMRTERTVRRMWPSGETGRGLSLSLGLALKDSAGDALTVNEFGRKTVATAHGSHRRSRLGRSQPLFRIVKILCIY